MLKKLFYATAVFALASCSGGSGPSEDEVKQALYKHYETTGASAELKQALNTEVAVKACTKEAAAYRCQIENKALNTSTGMLFVFDDSDKQWKFKAEGS
jgi:hypothetical protein